MECIEVCVVAEVPDVEVSDDEEVDGDPDLCLV